MRTAPSEHLHSRLMCCWVTVDRALRLAPKRSLSAARWVDARNALSEDIWQSSCVPKLGRFVARKGTTELDGAMLMLPLACFVAASDVSRAPDGSIGRARPSKSSFPMAVTCSFSPKSSGNAPTCSATFRKRSRIWR